VASSHGEVGEGGNEADETSQNTGNGDEFDDTVAILSLPAAIADSLEATADEDETRQEEESKGNPEDDAVVQAKVASVNGASRATTVNSRGSHGRRVRERGGVALDRSGLSSRSFIAVGVVGFFEATVAALLLGTVRDGHSVAGYRGSAAGSGLAAAVAHAWSLRRAALEALLDGLHVHRSGLAVRLLRRIRLLLTVTLLLAIMRLLPIGSRSTI